MTISRANLPQQLRTAWTGDKRHMKEIIYGLQENNRNTHW